MSISKWASVALASSLLALPALSRAAGLPNRAISAIDNNLGLSFVDSVVQYGERSGGPSHPYADTDSGSLPGLRIAASGLRDAGIDNLYLHFSFTQVSGNLEYNGATLNPPIVPLRMPQYSKMTDWGLRLGQGFVTGPHTLVIPYVAYGTHNWTRGNVFTEYYSNDYLGAGVLLQAAATQHLIMSLNLTYAETLRPNINSPSTPFHEGLGSSPWKRVGLSLDYRVSSAESFFAGASFTTFTYGQGPFVAAPPPLTGSIYEPYSKTNVVDYNIGVRVLY